jgi:hypothetical protein
VNCNEVGPEDRGWSTSVGVAVKLRRWLGVAVAAALASLVLGVGGASADPSYWGTVSSDCSSSSIPAPSGWASHPDSVARIVSLDSSVQGYFGDFGWASWSGSDTFWMPIGSTSSAFSLYSCSGSGFEVELADLPNAPTSFTGATTAGAEDVSPNSSGAESDLAFKAPIGDDYTAQVSLTQGAITLDDGQGHTQTFASSGTFDIGHLDAGQNDLYVKTQDGPQAHWTISITPAPLALSNVSASAALIRPSVIDPIGYTLSTDAQVSVAVRSQSGAVIRQLETNNATTAGKHTIDWDGLDANGNPSNVFGSSAAGTALVAVDTKPPLVSFSFGHRVRRSQGLRFQISDAVSGWKNMLARLDGRTRGFNLTRAGSGAFIASHRNGWSPGKHRLSIVATDSVGNHATYVKPFIVR